MFEGLSQGGLAGSQVGSHLGYSIISSGIPPEILDGIPDDFPDDTIPEPSPNKWSVEVRATIEQIGVPDCIDSNAITPGLPNNHTREMLDAEYAR